MIVGPQLISPTFAFMPKLFKVDSRISACLWSSFFRVGTSISEGFDRREEEGRK